MTDLRAESLEQSQVRFVQFRNIRRVCVIQTKDTSTEYGGEFRTRWLFSGNVSDEQLDQVINLEGNYCQHEYDCCGRFYQRPAQIKRDGLRTLVIQRSFQNV